MHLKKKQKTTTHKKKTNLNLQTPALSGSYWNGTTVQSLTNQGICMVIFSIHKQIFLPTFPPNSQCCPKWEWQIWTTQWCKPSLFSSLLSTGNCNPAWGTNPPMEVQKELRVKGRTCCIRTLLDSSLWGEKHVPKSYPVSVLNTTDPHLHLDACFHSTPKHHEYLITSSREESLQ